MSSLLRPQSIGVCVTHLRTLFISYHYLGQRDVCEFHVMFHRMEIT